MAPRQLVADRQMIAHILRFGLLLPECCADDDFLLAGDLQLENSIMKWLGVYSLLSSAAALASVLVHLRLSMSTHAQRTLDAASMDLDIKKKS